MDKYFATPGTVVTSGPFRNSCWLLGGYSAVLRSGCYTWAKNCSQINEIFWKERGVLFRL